MCAQHNFLQTKAQSTGCTRIPSTPDDKSMLSSRSVRSNFSCILRSNGFWDVAEVGKASGLLIQFPASWIHEGEEEDPELDLDPELR